MSQVSPHKAVEVPGSDSGKIVHLIGLITKGHGYFAQRKKSAKSSVFKINMGVKGVAVCDRKAVDVFWDVEKVVKEPAFGRLSYNTCLLDGYKPSMFSNGVPHDQQKAFVMKLCEVAQKMKIIPAASNVIKEYLKKWDHLSSISEQNTQCCASSQLQALNWEVDIVHMTSDIMTEAFFGVRVDPTAMYKMLKASWTKGKGALTRALVAAKSLKQSFRETPAIRNIFEMAQKGGISEEQAVVDVLFMLNFNSCGGLSGSIVSCIARLSLLDQTTREEMKREVREVLRSSNYELNEDTLGKMKELQKFIYEVLRMHPPVPVFFCRTRQDMTLDAASGSYHVHEGTLLVANTYMIQRDPDLFSDPDTFRPSRFENKQLLENLLYSYGPYTQSPTEHNHHCPGKDITFSVLKIVLVYFITCCDFKLTSRPYWSGKKLRRIGSPDKIMKLKYFNFDPTKMDSTKNMAVEDCEPSQGNSQYDGDT